MSKKYVLTNFEHKDTLCDDIAVKEDGMYLHLTYDEVVDELNGLMNELGTYKSANKLLKETLDGVRKNG